MNKYLHTVASVGFLFTLNYDARNHELKKIYIYNRFIIMEIRETIWTDDTTNTF